MKQRTSVAQDAGGDQRENGLAAADDQRMTGIVSALETRHRGSAIGQQVDDFAFALIAPLGADDDDEFTHMKSMAQKPRAAPSLAVRVKPSGF